MAVADNQEALEKLSRDSLGTGGVLGPEEFDTFLTEAQEEASLLGRVRTYPVNREKTDIGKLGIGEKHRRPQTEDQSGGGTISTNVTTIQIDTEKASVYWYLTKEMVEDNPEREQLAQKILNLAQRRWAIDTQDIAINGDTDRATGAAAGSDDEFYGQNDGWLALAADRGMPTYDNQEDLTDDSTVNPTDQPVDEETFHRAIQLIGPEYDRGNLAFMMSRRQLQEFKFSQITRQTPLGDAFLSGNADANPFGYDILAPAMWPDDKAMLTDPNNLIYAPYRSMEIDVLTESDEIHAKDLYAKYALRVRDDFQIEEEEAGVLITGLEAPA